MLTAMIPEKVRKVLQRYELEAVEFEPGSTPTAPLAAARLKVEVGQIAKSLLFRSREGRYAMVVCAGNAKVSNSLLKGELGSKGRMANAEETRQATGFLPGGVCPFGIEGVEILIDVSLAGWDTVYPAAGNDASGVATSYRQLLEITGGRSVRVTEGWQEEQD